MSNFSDAVLRLALRYQGHSWRTWFFGTAQARFRFGHWQCHLSKGPNLAPSQNRTTQLQISWPAMPLPLQIRHAQLVSLQPLWPDRSVAVPLPGTSWILSSPKAPEAEALVSPAVRVVVRQLSRLGSDPRVLVLCYDRKLSVIKAEPLVDDQSLEGLLRLATQLIGQMELQQSGHVQFVDEATIVDKAVCPVCSSTMFRDMVICNRCQTPHCYECWQYNGRCGVFACGEERFSRPAATPST